MFRIFRATRLLEQRSTNLPYEPPATCRYLGLYTGRQYVASRRRYTDIASSNRDDSSLRVTQSHQSDSEIDIDTLRKLSASSIKSLVLNKTSEASQHANLDVSLDIYLRARKIFRLEVLDPVKDYLYKELTTPTQPPRNEKGFVSESFEELKKRFPWPNTSPKLREAFHDDIGSKNVPAQRQQAYLKLYDATRQDPEPFLLYCDRIAARSERTKGSRSQKSSLVSAMSKECRDAGVILRYVGLDDDAAWLTKFSAYSDHKHSPRWSVKSIAPRLESRMYLAKIYERMKIDNHWNWSLR